jgi:hypothetical protein
MERFAEIRDSVFSRDTARRRFRHESSVRSEKNMRSDMVSADGARPGVESISNGVAFGLKRIAESVVERRGRGCRLGARIEKDGSWKCSWCGRANVRQQAGLDHCLTCNAEAFTYFTGVENELRVRYSRPPVRLSDAAVRFNSNGLKGVQQPSMSSNHVTNVIINSNYSIT